MSLIHLRQHLSLLMVERSAQGGVTPNIVSKIVRFVHDWLQMLHRSWCHKMLFTWYEWKSHFSSCLWKCPICGKSFKHASEISVHKMHHVRREAKLARLEEED